MGQFIFLSRNAKLDVSDTHKPEASILEMAEEPKGFSLGRHDSTKAATILGLHPTEYLVRVLCA